MARTKKVGITGRFGARYGRKAKRSVKLIEENMKKNHVCPKCDRPYVKRLLDLQRHLQPHPGGGSLRLEKNSEIDSNHHPMPTVSVRAADGHVQAPSYFSTA